MVKQAQKERLSAHRIHCAAQFAVASELCKRGYQVALTMGLYPVIDLMVVSPKGVPFLVDVKGQYQKNIWSVRLNKVRGKLFYLLAFVPHVGQNRFFVLTREAVEKEIRRDYIPSPLERVSAAPVTHVSGLRVYQALQKSFV